MKRMLAGILAAVAAVGLSAAPAAALERNPADMSAKAATLRAVNEDTVGLLYLPGADIFEPVLQGPEGDKNQFYLRRDFDKNASFAGSVFADYRCSFGDRLSRNTALYGNCLPQLSEGGMFTNLNLYREPAFCKENGILYFATPEELIGWELFAVSVITVDVPYNRSDLTDAQWLDALDKMKENALYWKDGVALTGQEQVLTLITNDTASENPISDTRLVVMAKRIAAADQTETEEAETPLPNENPGTGR